MAQYKTGTVSVTNGSQIVTGLGTSWLTEVTTGDILIILDDGVWYEVASITNDTSLALSANYAGTTGSGLTYAITRDFTSPDNIPYPEKGDIETTAIVKRAILTIQSLITTLKT